MSTSMKYERSDVIKKASDLYWEKGFHATSMRELQSVVDMRPGSIYASFGSKEGLFKESLQHYADTGLLKLKKSVEAHSSPTQGLKHFLIDAVKGGCKPAPSGLCMLVKTISELTEENAELLAEAKRLLGVTEQAFIDVLSEAQQLGELDPQANPARVARFIQVQFMGLRAYSSANEDSVSATELINEMFEHEHFRR